MASVYTATPTRADFSAWLRQLRVRQAEVRLLESEEVASARNALGKVIDGLAERMEAAPPGVSFEDRFGVPYVELRSDFHTAGAALSRAMRADLGLSAQ